jgi:hypothetical protein
MTAYTRPVISKIAPAIPMAGVTVGCIGSGLASSVAVKIHISSIQNNVTVVKSYQQMRRLLAL